MVTIDYCDVTSLYVYCVRVKARLVLEMLLDADDDVDMEFNLIKNAVQQERVRYILILNKIQWIKNRIKFTFDFIFLL